jgi:hypothetical protein
MSMKKGARDWGLGTGGRRPARRQSVPAPLAQSVLRLKKANRPWKRILFLTEPRGNVYENKGGAFHGLWRAGNVIENKGSYA